MSETEFAAVERSEKISQSFEMVLTWCVVLCGRGGGVVVRNEASEVGLDRRLGFVAVAVAEY